MNIMLPESHEWEMRPRWWMNISIVRLFPWNYAEEQNQESRFWNKYLFGQYFIFSTTYYLHKIRLQDDKTLHHCNIINNKHAQIIFLVGVPVHCSKRGNKILHRLHTLYIVDDTIQMMLKKNIYLVRRWPPCVLMVGLLFSWYLGFIIKWNTMKTKKTNETFILVIYFLHDYKQRLW